MNKESINLTKDLFLFFSFATSIILGAGYGMAGLWTIDILILFLFAFPFFAHKFNWNWVFSVALLTNTFLAALGMVLGAPSFLMIAGAVTALGSWELSNTEKKFKEIYSHPLSIAYQKYRVRLLGISLGSGLVVAEIVQFMQFKLPFIVIYLLIIMILYCFYQIHRLLSQTNQ